MTTREETLQRIANELEKDGYPGLAANVREAALLPPEPRAPLAITVNPEAIKKMQDHFQSVKDLSLERTNTLAAMTEAPYSRVEEILHLIYDAVKDEPEFLDLSRPISDMEYAAMHARLSGLLQGGK